MKNEHNHRNSSMTANGAGALEGNRDSDSSGHRKMVRKPVSSAWISQPADNTNGNEQTGNATHQGVTVAPKQLADGVQRREQQPQREDNYHVRSAQDQRDQCKQEAAQIDSVERKRERVGVLPVDEPNQRWVLVHSVLGFRIMALQLLQMKLRWIQAIWSDQRGRLMPRDEERSEIDQPHHAHNRNASKLVCVSQKPCSCAIEK